jgi:lambda repressor-like predicted transcriptional regulator
MLSGMHKEDVKAALRKKFGTVTAFEVAAGIPRGSVHEVLRNRKWRRVEDAISAALMEHAA